MKKNFFLITVIFVLLSSCSSGRFVPYKYEDVVLAAKEKFAVNEWTEFYTRKSFVRERPGSETVFTHYDWGFPEPKVTCIVEIDSDKGGMAYVYVFVREWDDWFSPLTYSPSKARKVLDIIQKRMESGSWNEMPWNKEDRLK